MKRQIKWMVYSIVLLLLGSCHTDIDTLQGGKDGQGIPIRFTASWPQSEAGTTRTITDKKNFKDKDMIHVSATFTLDSETLTRGEVQTVTKYTVLTLENGEWVNNRTEAQFDMSWPWNATGAEFTAYYLENWNGPITELGKPLESVVLDRFEYQERKVINPDPLGAKTEVIEYGHAVHLEFHHLCTRLTIVGVEAEEEYALRFKSVGTDERILNNACTMERSEKNELAFRFVAEESNKISSQVDKEGDEPSVTFHLEPGDYSTFTLMRRNGYSYITISNVEALKELRSGVSYTVSLEDLKGNITQDDQDDWWTDDDEPTPKPYDFDIDEFMEAIKACNKDYKCLLNGQEVTLLQKEPYRNEITLTADVDFGYKPFTSVELPDIVTFNGGGRSISGVANPMFSTLLGTVKELNLRGARLRHKESDPDAPADEGHDTGWGVLARVCEGGTISNVSLFGAELDITLHNSAGQAYSVGALVGNVPKGRLSGITLVGDIMVRAEAADIGVDYIACVGGVVGQCGGTLSDIDNLKGGSSSKITVSNCCKGHGSRYSGGVIGLLAEGIVEGCNLNANVDAKEAGGVWNYTGGVAGSVRKGGRISKAFVLGEVTGGNVTAFEGAKLHSATGGIVGHVDAASVMDCVTFSEVTIFPDYFVPYEQTWYMIGGVIGAMEGANSITNNEGRYAFDTTPYEDKEHYVAGTFTAGAGTEEALRADDNSADGTGQFVGWTD